ncbi:hypothetical protein [Rhizobium mesoamericanum]|nr:hypothetical protein [Rhizobium mesoamericanum]
MDDTEYQVPLKFNGTLEKVAVKLGPSQMQWEVSGDGPPLEISKLVGGT